MKDSTNNNRILIVDDDKAITEIIVKWLKKKYKGIQIDYTNDPNIALEMTSVTEYQLVIADIMMDELDGFEMVKRLNGSVQTIIYISGDEEMLNKVVENDIISTAMKPLEMKSLMEQVETKLRFADMLTDMYQNIKQIKNIIIQRKKNGWY